MTKIDAIPISRLEADRLLRLNRPECLALSYRGDEIGLMLDVSEWALELVAEWRGCSIEKVMAQ